MKRIPMLQSNISDIQIPRDKGDKP
jgi:hypothetical protein